ncbi:MAG: zinc-binding alcohol dehydrogenase family protein [Thermoanaerobaculia bacterium]|nr:zinc-binding alcohol dehydrogenase family protein [Thermoanaerobaculia bacterium]
MRAVGLTRYLPIDDPESLVDLELADPVPVGRDLLVRVKAISVNPVDTKVRRPRPEVEAAPKILGWDAAGVVEATGRQVTMFRPGDEVWYAGDITRHGCNSELQLVDERLVALKPRSLDFARAAAMPLTSLTVWEALFARMGIDPDGADRGSTLLLIGGAGGVGSIGIQVAKHAGLTVIATASREETRAWCRGLGADHVIDHAKPLREGIDDLGLSHVEFILNASDTSRYWDACCDLIAPQGTICGIVSTTGPVDIQPLMAKSARFVWELMFTRARFQTPDMIEQHRILARVAALVDAGSLQTTATEVLRPINAANLRTAHARLEEGRMIGKLALEGW